MAVTVIDASALVAVLFDEPEAKAVVEQLGEGDLVAPSLLDFEVANVCWLKIRRSPHQRTELLAGYRLRERFGIRHVPVDHEAVVALALETGLTAYDASYLWLARSLNAPLVTLDQALSTAAANFPVR